MSELTYEEAERLALRAIHDADNGGRGMVGRSNRNHLHQRVARAILAAARAEGPRPKPSQEAVMLRRLVDASAGLIVKAIREPGDEADLEEWTSTVTEARALLASFSDAPSDGGAS